MKNQYVCDCIKPGDYGYLKEGLFEPTIVNNEGICKYCGHYATKLKSNNNAATPKYKDERLNTDDDWIF